MGIPLPSLFTIIYVFQQSDTSSLESSEPQLERQVEIIRNLVDSYMKIVIKTQLDLVPKLLMHMLVNEVSIYIHLNESPSYKITI